MLNAHSSRHSAERPRLGRIDCGGCNGCDLEATSALNALYAADRFLLTRALGDPPPHILVISGALLRWQIKKLTQCHQRLAWPAIVIACGTCALSGGVFSQSYATAASVLDVVLPTVMVPGCPPTRGAMLDGLFLCLREYDRQVDAAQKLLRMPA